MNQSIQPTRKHRLLYGIREEHNEVTLFTLTIATTKVRNIAELGVELAPRSDFGPSSHMTVTSIRWSVSPDGNSIVYGTQVYKSNLWILEGFRQPGFLSRLGQQ